jgi:hypothetical protein
VSSIGSLERAFQRPSDILKQDFAIWSEAEWERAREEAIDLLLQYIDPRFSVEFQTFAGREVEPEGLTAVEYQEEHILRDFGKSVLRRLVRLSA